MTTIVSKKMNIAGNTMAADLMAATVAKSLNGNWDEFIAHYQGDNGDLLQAYVCEVIDSVTAIYIAMNRIETNSQNERLDMM